MVVNNGTTMPKKRTIKVTFDDGDDQGAIVTHTGSFWRFWSLVAFDKFPVHGVSVVVQNSGTWNRIGLLLNPPQDQGQLKREFYSFAQVKEEYNCSQKPLFWFHTN